MSDVERRFATEIAELVAVVPAAVVREGWVHDFADIGTASLAFRDDCDAGADGLLLVVGGRLVAAWWIDEGVPHLAEFVPEGGGYEEHAGPGARAGVRQIAARLTEPPQTSGSPSS